MFIQSVKITRSSSQISYVHTAIQHHIREKERASMQTLLSGVYNTDFNEGPPWTKQVPQCIPTGVRPSHSVWPQGSLSFEWQQRAFSARYVFTYYAIFQLISETAELTSFLQQVKTNSQACCSEFRTNHFAVRLNQALIVNHKPHENTQNVSIHVKAFESHFPKRLWMCELLLHCVSAW